MVSLVVVANSTLNLFNECCGRDEHGRQWLPTLQKNSEIQLFMSDFVRINATETIEFQNYLVVLHHLYIEFKNLYIIWYFTSTKAVPTKDEI